MNTCTFTKGRARGRGGQQNSLYVVRLTITKPPIFQKWPRKPYKSKCNTSNIEILPANMHK